MRYTKRVSRIDVVGKGWYGQTMALEIKLDDYALKNIVKHCEEYVDVSVSCDCDDLRHVYNRAGVEQWLMLNSGDFQSVTDFRVTISDEDGRDFDSDFATEDGECAWADCMEPRERET